MLELPEHGFCLANLQQQSWNHLLLTLTFQLKELFDAVDSQEMHSQAFGQGYIYKRFA